MSKRFLIVVASLVVGMDSIAFGQTPEIPATLPDAGISDEYLVKVGTAAVSLLSARLEKPANEAYFEGIVSRLRTISVPDDQQAQLTQSLILFVNKNIRRKANVGKTVFAVCSALETIGQRGGEAGVDYLADWFKTDKYAKEVKFYRGAAKSTDETKAQLYSCAARGLGFSGHPRALQALVDAQKAPPRTIWPENLAGVLKESIQLNQDTKRGGSKPSQQGIPK